MKPHHLTFCALGPYADEVEIDFDPLVEEGLFLIHGPTGAGKTFLLDALCFALYGDVPGERGRHTVRSDHAPLNVTPWAELEFTSQGHRWRVRRSPEHERAKKRGEGVTGVPASATLERHAGDEWRAVAAKTREVNNEINGLLGLTAHQFQQVILLPQGRFEQVLRSNSEDREKLLRALFDTTIFGAASDWLDGEARRRREAASRHEDELANLRRQAAERWWSVTDEPDAEGSRPTNGPADEADADESWPADQAALDELVQNAKSLKENAATAADSAEGVLTTARSTHVTIERIAEHWDRRAALRERRDELAEERPAIDADRETLGLAEAAEALRQVLDAEQRHRNMLEELTPLVTRQIGIIADHCAKALSLPDGFAVPASDETPTLNDLDAMSPALAAHRTKLESFIDDAKKAAGLETCATKQATELSALDSRVEKARGLWINARQETLDRRSTALNLRQRRLDGIAAELAGTLKDTAPCPVCGSTDHPSPAEPAADAVDAKDIKAAEKAVTEAAETEAKTHEAHQLLVDSAIELRVRSETTGQAAADLRAGIVEAIGDIDPAAAVADIDVVAGAVTTLASAIRDRATAKTVFETTAAALATQLASSPFATPDGARDALRSPEDRNEMRQRIKTHDNASRDVDRDLKADDLRDLPDERPDTTASAEIVTDAKDAAAAANAHRTRTADAHKDISGWSATHRRRSETYTTARAEAELWSTVANRCNGRTAPKVSLQRWVLSAYLEEICTFANERLGSMTGGRYRLSVHRDFERHGAQAGLGLRVHDTYTGREREVSTLSGGETFQASLSLALGVADVVTSHTGGVRLDALFVDEGFGTLDSEALQLAMDELDRLREGGRTVGLISHVSELRERIRTGIEVTATDHGSEVRVGTIARV